MSATISNQIPKAFPTGRAKCPICDSLLIAKCGEFNVWHWAHERKSECDTWKYEPKTEWHRKWQNYFSEDQTEVYIYGNYEYHRADIVTKKGLIIEIQNSPISPEDIDLRESFYGDMMWIINSKEFKHNLRFKNYAFDTGSEIWFRWVYQYPPNSDLGFSIVIPDDDDFDHIINSVKECEFTKVFDQERGIYHWVSKRGNYFELPLEIFNAFTSYLLDRKLICNLDESKVYKTNFRWLHLRKIWTCATMPKFIDLNNGFLFYIKILHKNGNGFGMIVSKQYFLKKYRV